MTAIPLSVLDLSPVSSGGTAAQALRNSVDLARRAEAFGYKRFWVAEHHLVSGVASAAPAVLTALIADATERIRVGSAAVLLSYHAPVAVAEQFGTIAQLHPNRIDLGVGRFGQATTAELLAKLPPQLVARLEAQSRMLHPVDAGEYPDQVRTILDFVDGSHPDFHAAAAENAELDVWVLGSNAGVSSATAGELGLPYGANYHVSPSTIDESVADYRAKFVPSTRLSAPYVVVSADVVVADTTERARELASPYGQWVLGVRTGGGAEPYPSPAEAAAFPWTEQQRAVVAERVATQFVGTAEEVARGLDELHKRTNADELLITTITHEHADRVRSYELLARAWGKA
jgi:luciferase family oxidoreductase group 1